MNRRPGIILWWIDGSWKSRKWLLLQSFPYDTFLPNYCQADLNTPATLSLNIKHFICYFILIYLLFYSDRNELNPSKWVSKPFLVDNYVRNRKMRSKIQNSRFLVRLSLIRASRYYLLIYLRRGVSLKVRRNLIQNRELWGHFHIYNQIQLISVSNGHFLFKPIHSVGFPFTRPTRRFRIQF